MKPGAGIFARWRARPRPCRWLGALLVAALLAVQWAGVEHQISHGVLTAFGAQQDGDAGDPSAPWTHPGGHSCVLFDAATLGSGPPACAAAALPAVPARFRVAAPPAAALPDLPLLRGFQPRAPPAIHA